PMGRSARAILALLLAPVSCARVGFDAHPEEHPVPVQAEDADNDGVIDADDAAPLDATRCRDVDADGCDDCSVTRNPPSTSNDGYDPNGDGICAAGDPNGEIVWSADHDGGDLTEWTANGDGLIADDMGTSSASTAFAYNGSYSLKQSAPSDVYGAFMRRYREPAN